MDNEDVSKIQKVKTFVVVADMGIYNHVKKVEYLQC